MAEAVKKTVLLNLARFRFDRNSHGKRNVTVPLLVCPNVNSFVCFSVSAQKTVLLSLKLAQDSRKRPLQLRSPLRDYHPVAGIHPGESPASSLAELQLLPHSPHIFSCLTFFFFKQGTPGHLSVPQESYLMLNRRQSPPHPQVHCFDTSFLKTVLYCLYCLCLFCFILF